MSDYSHVLTVKFKTNGEAEVELKSATGGPILEAKPVTIEASEKRRSKILVWCEGIGTAIGAVFKSSS